MEGPLDETTLIERCIDGDTAHCQTLFQQYHPMVLGVARRMLRDAHEAEDVAQETFERVFLNLHRFRRDARLSTWIRRIVVNLCLNRLRQRGQNVSLEAMESQIQATAGDPADREPSRDLDQGLARLTPEDRALIVMATEQPVSYDQMGQVFRLGRDEIRGRLYRARRKLKEWLQW